MAADRDDAYTDMSIVKGAADALGIRVTAREIDRFRQFAMMLVTENEKFNLTAITDPADIQRLHFADSLTVVPAVDAYVHLIGGDVAMLSTVRVLDIGSGAGFPGLPLAIMRPRVAVTLLEATGKKVGFMRRIADDLGTRQRDRAQRSCGRGGTPSHAAGPYRHRPCAGGSTAPGVTGIRASIRAARRLRAGAQAGRHRRRTRRWRSSCGPPRRHSRHGHARHRPRVRESPARPHRQDRRHTRTLSPLPRRPIQNTAGELNREGVKGAKTGGRRIKSPLRPSCLLRALRAFAVQKLTGAGRSERRRWRCRGSRRRRW